MIFETVEEQEFFIDRHVLVCDNGKSWQPGILQTVGSEGNFRFLVDGIWYRCCKPDFKFITEAYKPYVG